MASLRGLVTASSLLVRNDEIQVITDDDDDDGVGMVDLELSPGGASVQSGASKVKGGDDAPEPAKRAPTRTAAGSPSSGRSWLKPTSSTKTKSRLKAAESPTRKEKHYAMIEADEERLERALKKDDGVKAGERMYHAAVMQRKRKDADGDAVAVGKDEAAGCTFKPTLCVGTMRALQESGGYRPPAERFDAQELRLAKVRLMQRHANERIETAGCTFKPKIETVSAALVRRSRSASGTRDVPTGKRLFDESTQRTHRQSVLALHIKRTQDEERVGGSLKLSRADADAVARRLREWERARSHNLETLRQEEVMTWRPRRSRSMSDDKLFFDRLAHPSAAASSPTRDGADKALPKRRCHSSCEATPSRPEAPLVSERSKLLADELRKIRFRALFAKYMPSACKDGNCLTIGIIRDQVHRLFPHEMGILSALNHLGPADAPIQKDVFVAALCAFERRYGPQPWGRMEHHHLHDDDDESDSVDGGQSRRRRREGVPQISAHSEEIISHRNRDKKPIYDFLIERGIEAEKRRSEKMSVLEAERAKGLTFHPSINSLPPTHTHGTHSARRSVSGRSTPAVPNSLNVSLEHAGGTTPRTPGGRRTSCSDEVDNLLMCIDEQLSGLCSAPPPYGERCQTPITPRGRAAVNRLNATPQQSPWPPAARVESPVARNAHNADGGNRTPLLNMDWNQQRSVGNARQPGTPPASVTPVRAMCAAVSPSPLKRPIASFAAAADGMLDNIYCQVSVEKRYAQKQLRERSPKSKRPATTRAAGAPKPFR